MKPATVALAALALVVYAQAAPRDVNYVVNPGFEEHADGRAGAWAPAGEGYQLVREGRGGGWCM
ncbi:MAG: hypothetical protein J7M38_07670, partial [Armatimonadetes bacterium]|nr:hypothetical protein [Armatimonadota bacterium]